jgi:hypothetical protein
MQCSDFSTHKWPAEESMSLYMAASCALGVSRIREICFDCQQRWETRLEDAGEMKVGEDKGRRT